MVALEAKVYYHKHITCHPSVSGKLNNSYVYDKNMTTVIDGNLITGAGPATALDFSFAIIQSLAGKSVVDDLKPKLVYKDNAII